MKITAIKTNYFQNSKNYNFKKRVHFPVLNTNSTDTLTFKGNDNLSKKIGIVSTLNPTELEKNIEANLDIEPLNSVIKKFQNGETYVNIIDSVRGKDIYLMPASGKNVNDNLMETYLKADAAKRAGASRVIAIIPNLDYARQEKKTELGEPIAARLNIDLLKTSGVDEIITEDLHTPAIEGFADGSLKITHLKSMPLIKEYIENKGLENLVIVSPDMGGTKRMEQLAKMLECDKAIVYKHRQAHNEAKAEDLVGNVYGKTCIIYDDIIDTGGTIAEAAKLLNKNGAKEIYVCATHGLFNGEAMQKLQLAPVKEVIVTNSVPQKDNEIAKIKHVDISKQIADAIKEISADE